jgi:hypothetical protein
MDLNIKLRYKEKGCVARNPHVKYESPITNHSKDISNVKNLKKYKVGQTPRSRS